MKRFQKALLGVVVSGALLFSAQAAELSSSTQDTLQSAMTKVQQEVKDYGQVKTLGFTGENCEIILSNLNAKQYLVNLTADSTHKYGILDKATGKLVVPVEYDYYIALDGTETLVSQYDADHHPNYWFAVHLIRKQLFRLVLGPAAAPRQRERHAVQSGRLPDSPQVR